MYFIFKNFFVRVSSLLSYQYYLTNRVTEHHFIGIWASEFYELYGVCHQKHMEIQYPTNPTLI